jgi:hypothetical protein
MQKLTHSEITEVERKLGVSLPGLYRNLLLEMGHGSFDQSGGSKSNTTKELYHPEEVRALYTSFFENPDAIFNPYFPFGCNNNTQELWIIDAAVEKAASISHETHPDDWPEENWMSYGDWTRNYFPQGKKSEDDTPRS